MNGNETSFLWSLPVILAITGIAGLSEEKEKTKPGEMVRLAALVFFGAGTAVAMFLLFALGLLWDGVKWAGREMREAVIFLLFALVCMKSTKDEDRDPQAYR